MLHRKIPHVSFFSFLAHHFCAMPVGVIITLACAHTTNDNAEKCCFPVVWNALSALKLKVNPVLTEVLR